MRLSPLPFIDDYLSRPWLIGTSLTGVVFLPLIPQIYLSYLLFSPKDTVLLRRTLLVPTLLFSLFSAFSFMYDEPHRTSQGVGLRCLSAWFYMRGIEVGLRREAPTWVGYEEESRRIWGGKGKTNGASEHQGNGNGVVDGKKKDRSERTKYTRWDQFVNGISYFFAFRLNLGWSNSLANASLVPPFRHRTRSSLLLEHFTTGFVAYVLWDASNWMMGTHPTFKTFDKRLEGSIWEEIPLMGERVVLSPFASAMFMTVAHFGSLFSSIWSEHHIICFVYTLFHPGRPVAPPPFFGNIFKTTSLNRTWSQIWHQAVRGSFLFIAGDPAGRLVRRLGGGKMVQRWISIIAVFAFSAIQHGPLYTYNPQPEFRAMNSAYIRFFFIQPIAMAFERLFLAVTRRKVGGPLGAIWTWTVLIWAGLPVVEGFQRMAGTCGMGGGDEGEVLMPFGSPFRSSLRWLKSM